jgi:hypothetical protein
MSITTFGIMSALRPLAGVLRLPHGNLSSTTLINLAFQPCVHQQTGFDTGSGKTRYAYSLNIKEAKHHLVGKAVSFDGTLVCFSATIVTQKRLWCLRCKLISAGTKTCIQQWQRLPSSPT